MVGHGVLCDPLPLKYCYTNSVLITLMSSLVFFELLAVVSTVHADAILVTIESVLFTGSSIEYGTNHIQGVVRSVCCVQSQKIPA